MGYYSNSYVVSEAQELEIVSGLWYVNIHTAVFPGGEIRGQLTEGTLPVELKAVAPEKGNPVKNLYPPYRATGIFTVKEGQVLVRIVSPKGKQDPVIILDTGLGVLHPAIITPLESSRLNKESFPP